MTEFALLQFHVRTLWTDPNSSCCNSKSSIRVKSWINTNPLLHFPEPGNTGSAKASPLPPKPVCIPQNLSGAGMARGEMETEGTRNTRWPWGPSAVPGVCPKSTQLGHISRIKTKDITISIIRNSRGICRENFSAISLLRARKNCWQWQQRWTSENKGVTKLLPVGAVLSKPITNGDSPSQGRPWGSSRTSWGPSHCRDTSGERLPCCANTGV